LSSLLLPAHKLLLLTMIQIGGTPRAIEERNYKKRKSNDGDDQ
jgi:hypothetical protein